MAMTETRIEDTRREDVEMLVPFYVTGRISQADARLVDAYLREHPEFARSIEIAREERAADISVNEALGFPSPRASDKVFEAIATEPEPVAARAGRATRSLMERVRDFFAAPSPLAVRYAAVAAAAIVLVQAAVIGSMIARGPAGDGFETASGPKVAAAASVKILVAFQDGATFGEVSRVLGEVGGTLIEGPLKGGFYRIRLDVDAVKADAVAARVALLKSKGTVVKMVLPSN